MQTQTSCAPNLGRRRKWMSLHLHSFARWPFRFPEQQSALIRRLPLGRSRFWITREGRRVKAPLRRASLGLDPPSFPRNTSSYDGQASLPSGNLRFPLTFTYHGCPLFYSNKLIWSLAGSTTLRACRRKGLPTTLNTWTSAKAARGTNIFWF